MGVSGVDAPEQSPRGIKWLRVHAPQLQAVR